MVRNVNGQGIRSAIILYLHVCYGKQELNIEIENGLKGCFWASLFSCCRFAEQVWVCHSVPHHAQPAVRRAASEFLGVQLYGHIIVGRDSWFIFAKEGKLAVVFSEISDYNDNRQ